ncbi:MAG: hypothetical protein ACK4KT_08920 [Thermaurantimonas sp.]
MKKIFLQFLLIISCIVHAQQKDTTDEYTLRRVEDSYEYRTQSSSDPWGEKRVFYGGNFGLSFGNFTNIMLNPRVSVYEPVSKSILGGGLIYQYINNFGNRFNIGGFNLLAHKLIYNTLYFGIESEMLHIWSRNVGYWSYPFMVGGGFFSVFTGGFYSFGLFYPVYQGANPIYPNTVILRFNIGF